MSPFQCCLGDLPQLFPAQEEKLCSSVNRHGHEQNKHCYNLPRHTKKSHMGERVMLTTGDTLTLPNSPFHNDQNIHPMRRTTLAPLHERTDQPHHQCHSTTMHCNLPTNSLAFFLIDFTASRLTLALFHNSVSLHGSELTLLASRPHLWSAVSTRHNVKQSHDFKLMLPASWPCLWSAILTCHNARGSNSFELKLSPTWPNLSSAIQTTAWFPKLWSIPCGPNTSGIKLNTIIWKSFSLLHRLGTVIQY